MFTVYQLDKGGSITQSQGRQEYHAYSKKKVGQILRTNFLVKIIEGKIEGGIEVRGRRVRRLKETRGYWKLKEEC